MEQTVMKLAETDHNLKWGIESCSLITTATHYHVTCLTKAWHKDSADTEDVSDTAHKIAMNTRPD